MLPSPSPAEACLTRDRKRSRENAKKTQQRCEAKPGSVPRDWIMKEDAGGRLERDGKENWSVVIHQNQDAKYDQAPEADSHHTDFTAWEGM